MSVFQRFGLSKTSERTVEFNVLNELAAYLWSKFGLTLTVISPTQVEEYQLGFDDIIEGLPPGRVLVFQFKRPGEMIIPRGAVRFTLDTSQLNQLAINFPRRNEAYIVLAPLPRNQQIINHRRRLLTVTAAVDIHNIPNLRKTTQKTRTVRLLHPLHISLLNGPSIEVADPRKYESVKAVTLADLGEMVSTADVGYTIGKEQDKYKDTKDERPKKIGVQKLYYLHISRQQD